MTFIPAYAYVGRNRVELASGRPRTSWDGRSRLRCAAAGIVVIKPHLEPAVHSPGYRRAASDNHSWRAECGWRGFFDVDPMTPDYREGVVLSGLRMLKQVFDRLGDRGRRARRGCASSWAPS